MPAKKPQPKKFYYMNAYMVIRKAPHPGPHARVTNHGIVLGSLQYPAGNTDQKKKAMRELYEKYGHVVRADGKIYKIPHAVALWVYGESHPAENWIDNP
jgi:hypothetical protein